MYFQLSPILGCWGVKLGLVGVVLGGAIAFGNATLAQVVPDNTLGVENSVVTDTGSGVDTISGGATRGGNLFHSFQQFSVPTNGAAFFNNATNIQNILTRVTGGSISEIDGLIGANGAANLFLLNPNGIVFGQNARLNIGGSFVATTASSINFADGTQFSATPSTGAPLLTVSVPLGLQFGTGSGNIINRASGVGLQVQPGRTIGIVGGNINLEGGRLTAEGGRIELGAVAAPGVVGISPDSSGFRFSFPTDLTLGDISLTNSALVDVRAGGGGNIAVNARNLMLSGGSQLIAGIGANLGSTTAVAGSIDINAQDAIAIDGVGQFPDGVFSSGFFNGVDQGGIGKGGNVNIRSSSLSLTNGGRISLSTFGIGNAGNVNIAVSNRIFLDNSAIFSRVNETAIGDGGNISINTRSLNMTNGAELTGATLGQGDAGDIQITVADSVIANSGSFLRATSSGEGNAGNVMLKAGNTISFDNSGSDEFAGAYSSVRQEGRGNGGNIDLTARRLFLDNGAQLVASTAGQGDAGNINIAVSDVVFVTGVDRNGFASGVFSQVETGGIGKGGNIDIKTGSLSLANGAFISAGTSGRGDAGNVNITAADGVSLDDGVIASRVRETARGNGGNITINARSLSLTNGGSLNTSTSSQGDAGDINITIADTLSLTNGGAITANSFLGAEGDAGSINVAVRSLNLDNGSIFAQSISGDGGDIDLEAGQRVGLRNGSQITTSVGTEQKPGNGGNITINSPLVIANFNGNNDIITNAFFGSGGGIRINAPNIIGFSPLISRQTVLSLFGNNPTVEEVLNFLNDSRSNDVASLSGSLEFNFDSSGVFSAADLVELPTTPVDASTLVATGCPSGAENRFVVAGRGGLPPAPGDKLSTDALLTDWATLQTPETENRATVETTTPEVINDTTTSLVEATTWQFGSKGEIILTNADRTSPNQFNATPTSCPSS
ncbi:filamentous hemagglutinin N-terminal domain-containing protein [Chroococcidiopsis sp. CCNUC1]|uniref:two-partner secretion domain-containing protein n=1 Tax=Chroococcidiopsis sp. CCNUC1 TaxID=2653189 RepID=UPI002020B71C|nr:filamentous hemagglutinin N-terminal domain-containing protein [Chroococcidiopsis sp. CCNUC1]URD47997.1 filamentous hemagglutinin N-terminal domain-containing protein [Chroococcidiopsis sp. CCNUC1]